MISFKRPASTPRFSRLPVRVPELYNDGTVLALEEYRALAYRGRSYIVAPVSYTDGIKLQRLQIKVIELQQTPATQESTTEFASLLRQIADLAGVLLIPCGWRRKLRWLKKNPFRSATEAELGAILDFLLLCRTTSHVRLEAMGLRVE